MNRSKSNGKFISLNSCSNNQFNQSFEPITKPLTETFYSEYGERKWLLNHGKSNCINFSDQALMELRKYFDSLDEKQNGSLGVQQLEDPFIAFGLSQSRQQVEQLIKSVDLDGSGKIQFDQFLEIMLKIKRGNANSKNKNSAMFDFFQKLSSGKLGESYNKDVSFKLNVSQYRRKKILQSIMAENKQRKEKGFRIMKNFKNQVLNNTHLKEILCESKKSNIHVYGFQRN